jgi:hypothetical protein
MSVVMLAIAIAGFLPAIADRSTRLAPLTTLAAVHGMVCFGWLLLFFTQTTLIAQSRIGVHRRLGIAGALMAIAMLGLGYATTIAMGRRGFDLSGDLNLAGDAPGQMVFPLGDLVSFGILIAAGIWFRRQPEIHKRLMLLGTAGGLMPAALAHVIGHIDSLRTHPGLIAIPLALLFFAAPLYDRVSRGRFNPVSLWVAVALFVWGNLRAVAIGPSTPWHDLVGWLIK